MALSLRDRMPTKMKKAARRLLDVRKSPLLSATFPPPIADKRADPTTSAGR